MKRFNFTIRKNVKFLLILFGFWSTFFLTFVGMSLRSGLMSPDSFILYHYLFYILVFIYIFVPILFLLIWLVIEGFGKLILPFMERYDICFPFYNDLVLWFLLSLDLLLKSFLYVWKGNFLFIIWFLYIIFSYFLFRFTGEVCSDSTIPEDSFVTFISESYLCFW